MNKIVRAFASIIFSMLVAMGGAWIIGMLLYMVMRACSTS